MYIRKWTHCNLVNAGGACGAGNPGAKALSLEKIITLFIGLVVGTVALPFLVLIVEFLFLLKKKKKKIPAQSSSADDGSNPVELQSAGKPTPAPAARQEILELEMKLEMIEQALKCSNNVSKQDILEQMSNLLLLLTQLQTK